MKKLTLLLVAIFASLTVFANIQGHFFMNVEDENVQVENVESHFAQWLDLPANTTFVLFRDETDNLGIRHLSYQQSVDGTIIQNGIVLVHAKNGIVYAVNGDIMDATIAAQLLPKKITPLNAAQRVRKKANASDAQLKIIRVSVNGEDVFRYAYEVLSDDHTAKLYVDAETGEIIKTKPLVYNADVSATAMTMYSGTQPITCFENEGLYYLHDEGRGIVTLNATNMYDPNDEYRLESIFNLQDDAQITAALYDYFSDCEEITNPTTTWGGFWMMLLENVKIEDVEQNSNWYSIGEGKADVYIKIKDNTGSVVFTSSRYDDPTFPVTFNIGMEVPNPPFYIEVWDYDPIGSDDLIETITIETIRGENKTYDGLDFKKYPSIVELTCRIESLGRHPFLDAHWGMEKTVDFYREKFNRNSYDNQGSVVYQLLNPPSTYLGLLGGMYANACAIGDQDPAIMIYGMGELSSNSEKMAQSTNPFVAVDIMAHEYSHLVTENNGNGGLEYIGESGALNESFSDIMGISVLKYATNYNDWLLGSDVMVYVSNMRSFNNPNNGEDGLNPQPDTYEGLYWADPQDRLTDNGGVHTNSGVQNHWFYLLTEGGNGMNDINNTFSVTGVGIDKAVQIAYRNLIYYLTPEATYEDARNGSIQAAIDLYGVDSQEYQSVMNAWHAVGVGDKYINENAEPIEYYIVAKRSSGNYYFFTPNKVSGKNRLVAVDAGTSVRSSIDTIHTTTDYLWIFEENKLKSHNGQYLACTAAKSAVMNTTGTDLTMTNNSDGSVTFSYVEDTETRYLSLATSGNDYFVFYANTNQFTHLFMLPKGKETTTPIPTIEVSPQAQKILRDGQICIIRGNKIYTIQGQEIK